MLDDVLARQGVPHEDDPTEVATSAFGDAQRHAIHADGVVAEDVVDAALHGAMVGFDA